MSAAVLDTVRRRPDVGDDESAPGLRVPPHSIEAESGVLSALLLDASSAWPQAAGKLQAGHFFRHAHGLIFAAVAAMTAAGHAVDVLTVFAHLQAAGIAEETGGLEYLNRLAQYAPANANVARYVEIVLKRARHREIIALLDRAIAGHFALDPISLRDAAEATQRAAQLEGEDTDAASDSERLRALTVDLAHLAGQRVSPPAFVIADWIPEGYVTLLASHGAGGKSMLGLYVAIGIAAGLPLFGKPASPPRRVLVYSCEDRAPVLHWRVQQYCAALAISPASLDGWLFLIDAGELPEPELFVAQRGSPGTSTAAFAALQRFVDERAIDILNHRQRFGHLRRERNRARFGACLHPGATAAASREAYRRGAPARACQPRREHDECHGGAIQRLDRLA
ncbi:DnaB-like helicase N-terminal domain-containing protein [Variovorax sp. J22R24]|uniref:DnaB-like helicase N-terminal domain-containing protein n=1 Tax=Variovorax gracilis TaxID=3053502 RepID=UPI002576DCC7|nr:DnaB-like helicase N-terminal domain-containing protein [Variovorax sp. J22R24]MDM0107795.1 DnaB-like helicase N-terminal domain-containing protein [Variovorax sp. J22R24]